MSEFEKYRDLTREIHAPDQLKQRVLEKAAQQRAQQESSAQSRKPDKYFKPQKPLRKLLLAAAAAALLLAGCAAAVHYSHSLMDHIRSRNIGNPEDYGQLLVTAPRETLSPQNQTAPQKGTEPAVLASAKDDVAEYQVLEAILDSESLYLHLRIKPLSEDLLMVDQLVEPESSVKDLLNPELTEGTVQEYADSLGKKLCYAGLTEKFEGHDINGWGYLAETAPDGSLHVYGSGNNPSGAKELTVGLEGYTFHPEEGPSLDRTYFELTLQDHSTCEEMIYQTFRVFDPDSPDLEKELGILLDSLTMKKTELGFYGTFTYRLTEEEQAKIQEEIQQMENGGLPESEILNRHLVGFVILDENGAFFQTTGPDGGNRGIVDNGDGTFSYTVSIPKVENPGLLKFKVLTAEFEKVGIYAYES